MLRRYGVWVVLLAVIAVGVTESTGLSEAAAAIRQSATRFGIGSQPVASNSGPDTATYFGPKQFLSTSTKKDANYVESFSVPTHPGPLTDTSGTAQWQLNRPAYTVRITRVGGGTLTTATVALNGNQLATAADFASASYVERSVSLFDYDFNTQQLTVALRGTVGAGLVVTIVGVPNSEFQPVLLPIYRKMAATPTHYSDSFSLTAEASAPFRITATASNAGTKATITLNGVQVIKDTDFGTSLTYVSKSVNLLSAGNSIQIDVRGNLNTSIIVQIWATDKTPPVLSIATPQNLVTNATSVAISGTSQDRDLTQVQIQGPLDTGLVYTAVQTSPTNPQFSRSVPLRVGSNLITIRATDQSGNHTDSTRTVTRDTVAPSLTVSSPVDGIYTNKDSVTVAGTVRDASTVTVKVNGVNLPVAQGGAFSGSYHLADGVNFLTITATDAGGNVKSETRRVTQAKQPPVLTVTAPSDGFANKTSPVTVTGTVTGTTPITVTANGVGLTVTGNSFSGSVPLAEGANDIAITATDPAGNATSVHRLGKLDTHAPVLTLTAPANASYTNSANSTVSGTVTDESAVTLTINGTPVTVGANGSFSTVVPLSAGSNQITVTATDAATNGTTLSRTVTLDQTPPTLTVAAPTNGAYSNAASINVAGTASDASPVTVKVNGTPVTLSPDGTFSFSLALTSGSNAVSVIATDGATNSTTVARTVTQDLVAPTFTVDFPNIPSQGTLTNADHADVVITTADASPVTVTLNGAALTMDGNGKFSGTVPLVEGANSVSVVVSDAAGNTGISQALTIYRDSQPPTVEIDSPADGAQFTTEPVTVSGSIHDSNTTQNSFVVTINGVSVTPSCSDPGNCSFSTPVHLVSGSNTISTVVREGAGNTTTVTRTVSFGGGGQGLPPDPATIAPKLDATVATTAFAATSFLYTGANPIQTGVAAGTIERLRAGEVRGSVRGGNGTALSGVKVTVLNHPEFGQTLSRVDGMFDLVVNGGGYLTLNYQKDGYLPVQRAAVVKWQDYVRIDTVTMLPFDPASTVIDFSQPAEVARGSTVTDSSGTRRVTMIFKGGTHASLQMPDGSSQAATSLTVRATEYTVGPTGPSAMPGELPAPSAYTYAVELSADEAVAAGAASVTFDTPVSVYVDNFLNFPTGIAVPVGFYDRSLASWIPVHDGRIVKILDITAGEASLDVDGSGIAASQASLAALGIDDAERTKLAELYSPGKTIWRMQVSHFSPYDGNWAMIVPPRARRPKLKHPDAHRSPTRDNCTDGSIIGCERQTLGERLGVAGTSLSLYYQSAETPGYKSAYATDFAISDDSIPPEVLRIEVQVTVAGQVTELTFPAAPNQSAHFVWDGKDAFGRPVQGIQPAHIRVAYIYNFQYAQPAGGLGIDGFGGWADSPLANTIGRRETALWDEMDVRLGSFGTPTGTLGGWTLDAHHSFDPVGRVLHLGNGETRDNADLAAVATNIASLPFCPLVADSGHCAVHANPGDRALDVSLDAQGMGIASDGTMYLADGDAMKIWRVKSDGTLEHIAGNGTTDFNGDGIPATSAGIFPEGTLRVGPDNSVYFVDYTGQFGNGRIRRVDKNGTISTAAGSGICGDSVRTGIPATEADLCAYDFTLAKDGTLYVLDGTEVYRVGADGIITRVVGDGSYARCPTSGPSYTCAEGQRANAHGVFNSLNGIAIGPDGSMYLANGEDRASNSTIIYRIGQDGIIKRVAGTGNNSHGFLDLGNGGPATGAVINAYFVEPAVGPDGTLYFTGGGYLRRVDPSGALRILAGCISFPTPVNCVNDGGQRATATTLHGPFGVDIGPDGRVYILDNFARRIDRPLPTLDVTDIVVASDEGSELYIFDADGKHLRTIDPLLGHTVYEFGYTDAGLLSTITDVDGNVTRIERDGSGAPTAVVAPFGQRTELTLNGDKYLATVTRPGEPPTVLTYTGDGLLQTLTDRNGNLHRFTYTNTGLLQRDDDPAGGFKTLVRSVGDSSSAVTVTTALGKSISYSTTHYSNGASQRTTVDSAGLSTTQVNEINGNLRRTSPDGMVATVSTVTDTRLGVQAPVLNKMTTQTPGGLLSTVFGGRRTVLADSTNPLTLVSRVDSSVVNGQVFRLSYAAASRTFTETTPLGRTSTHTLNASGRLSEEARPDVTPVEYQYDTHGRLSQLSQGPRQWTYAYDAQGRVATKTDPLTRNTQYFYDAAGRLERQILADSRELVYAYDSTGNLRSIAPVGRPAHQFEYNSINLLSSYDPPSLGAGSWSTTYHYNVDQKLTEVTRPDGQVVSFGYDGAGRVSTVTVPGGTVHNTYDPATGHRVNVTGPNGESLALTYDGSLLTGVTFAGDIAGTVTATYNNDFKEIGLSVNGDPAVGFAYDSDGLLSQAGDLTINRSPTNGLLAGTTLGGMSTSQSYSAVGELSHYTASVGGSALFDAGYTRDAVGRISELTESVGGVTTTKSYSYDAGGRLKEARENGTLVAAYDYDPDGNRSTVTRPSGVETGTYDDQDRLLSRGTASYTYTRNGELSTKTVASEVTRYDYDVLGNLRRVTLPNGEVIDYVLDGANRRVGKKVNGVLVQGFLFQTQLNPIAELGANGGLVSRFIYGTRSNVPDYIVKNGVTYRLVSDHLGSVRLVVDVSTGAIAQRIDYDEWGRVTQNTNPGFQPFGYAGGQFDSETGLLRYGARDYDPETGRWTAKDPVGVMGGGLNMYTYVLNDPINEIDPSGECLSPACKDALKHAGLEGIQLGAELALGLEFHDALESLTNSEELARAASRIERIVSEPTTVDQLAHNARGFKVAADFEAESTTEGVKGIAKLGGASASVGATAAEAILNDKPWWYDAYKFLPGGALGLSIGEAANLCIPWLQ
jgi:RHS repeat-associated protein